MSETTSPPTTTHKALNAKTIALIVLPLLLLVGVIVLFLATNGAGLHIEPVVPVETITFNQTVLRTNSIEFHIRNTSA